MLLDREQQAAALEAAYRECGQGRGAVAVIRGPVGSGKTVLLQAFTGRSAAAGATVLGAVASRAERGLPLGVIGQLFRCPLPAAIASQAAELIGSGPLDGQLGPADQETVSPVLAGVCEGLFRLLTVLSGDGPVVLAVDGIQYADVASLQCLSYLARRAGSSPILTVLTECTGTLPADRLLHAELLRQGNCHSVPVGPLSPASVAGLLADHLGTRDAQLLAPDCRAMTGDSPLLVTAIAQDAKTAGGLVPGPAFRSAVVTCLHRYEPGMVELGQAVAVLGREATAGLLGELLAVSPESAAQGLDALGASGLLKSGEFRHEQARQAVLSHMTAEERAAMHGAAARALYRTGASSDVLARHITAAHRIGSRWAVAALREAAEQALAGGETERAVGYLMRAQVECADDRQRAAIIFALTRAEWPADPERAARHLPELVATARSGLLGGDYLGELAHYLLWTGETSSAAEILAALGTAPAGPAAASRPLEFLYPDAVGQARSAVRDSASPAPGPARPPAGRAGASGAQAGATHDAAAIADRILTERNLNDPALASPAVLASTTAALMGLIGLDMLDRAASWCETLLRESGASGGSPLWRAALTSFSAMIDIRCGDLQMAEDRARSALAMLTPRAWGVAIGVPLSSLLLSTTASGQHEDAATGLRIPVPEAMFGTVYGLLYLSARGEYYLATGRPHTALADFSCCGRRMTAWGLDLPGLIPWRIRSAEAYLALGNPSEARELTEEQLALAGASFPRTRGISLRVLALASPSAKRTALLRESAEALRNSGAWLELARTFTELSHAHLALGEHGRAHWAARQARNLAGRCGTQAPAITRPQREASGGRPPGAAAVRLLPQLSDAEQRVATLAAYGYTNGQIARKLYITVSTVEQHLTKVYRKLGVASRAELPVGL